MAAINMHQNCSCWKCKAIYALDKMEDQPPIGRDDYMAWRDAFLAGSEGLGDSFGASSSVTLHQNCSCWKCKAILALDKMKEDPGIGRDDYMGWNEIFGGGHRDAGRAKETDYTLQAAASTENRSMNHNDEFGPSSAKKRKMDIAQEDPAKYEDAHENWKKQLTTTTTKNSDKFADAISEKDLQDCVKNSEYIEGFHSVKLTDPFKSSWLGQGEDNSNATASTSGSSWFSINPTSIWSNNSSWNDYSSWSRES